MELLPPRVLRCYRYFESGHVRAKCTAEADRNEDCDRCSKHFMYGHGKLLLRAAAKRTAEHRMGSKKFYPPKRKKGAKTITALVAKLCQTAAACPPTEKGKRGQQSREVGVVVPRWQNCNLIRAHFSPYKHLVDFVEILSQATTLAAAICK